MQIPFRLMLGKEDIWVPIRYYLKMRAGKKGIDVCIPFI